MANNDGTYDLNEYLKDSQEMLPHEFIRKYSDLSLLRWERGTNKLQELQYSMEIALQNDFQLDKLQIETWLAEIKEIRKLL
jgi:hypothetical protein